ncbi:hypothetical protein [Variovorax sp. DXTD-1]|uniref:hypothetical protein n=1 Tax=Variovorax sp. DXTD-1 TaxID=2495592 RepID=UPI000F88E959|nr:hypothetical protein [Variovorax sp. DXTD-1]RST46318.1 hypothetical protein EJI00_21560 [Variovorax sp. DXTD-1]
MKIHNYPYRPKPLLMAFSALLFGLAAYGLWEAAQTNDRGLVINRVFRFSSGEATIIYWCLAALVAALAGSAIAALLRGQFFPQRVTLTENELVAPRSAFSKEPTLLRLFDIQHMSIWVLRKKRSLKIVHFQGELAIHESWLPSAADFDELCHEIEIRHSEIVIATRQRMQAEAARRESGVLQ